MKKLRRLGAVMGLFALSLEATGARALVWAGMGFIGIRLWNMREVRGSAKKLIGI